MISKFDNGHFVPETKWVPFAGKTYRVKGDEVKVLYARNRVVDGDFITETILRKIPDGWRKDRIIAIARAPKSTTPTYRVTGAVLRRI